MPILPLPIADCRLPIANCRLVGHATFADDGDYQLILRAVTQSRTGNQQVIGNRQLAIGELAIGNWQSAIGELAIGELAIGNFKSALK